MSSAASHVQKVRGMWKVVTPPATTRVLIAQMVSHGTKMMTAAMKRAMPMTPKEVDMSS